jgi:hypothetical protein
VSALHSGLSQPAPSDSSISKGRPKIAVPHRTASHVKQLLRRAKLEVKHCRPHACQCAQASSLTVQQRHRGATATPVSLLHLVGDRRACCHSAHLWANPVTRSQAGISSAGTVSPSCVAVMFAVSDVYCSPFKMIRQQYPPLGRTRKSILAHTLVPNTGRSGDRKSDWLVVSCWPTHLS